jgi:hypothetical protein
MNNFTTAKNFRVDKNRDLYEAKTAVLYGSITPKSLQLILISLLENKEQ